MKTEVIRYMFWHLWSNLNERCLQASLFSPQNILKLIFFFTFHLISPTHKFFLFVEDIKDAFIGIRDKKETILRRFHLFSIFVIVSVIFREECHYELLSKIFKF